MLSRRVWSSFSRCRKLSPHSRGIVYTPSCTALAELGLFPYPPLINRGDHNARAADGATKGCEKYMSSRDMYRHLGLLQELVPGNMRARFEIETILFRVSAMLQHDRHLVFGVKDGVVPVRVPCLKGSRAKSLSGTPGYGIYVADCAGNVPDTHLNASHANYLEPEGLFIAESDREDLEDRLPHAVARMYAIATRKEVKVIRGVISNGWEWEFILLQLNEKRKGGKYMVAPEITVGFQPNYPNHVINRGPDVVAGVLAHWIERCHDDLDENDWFEVDKESSF